jgi:hypothetical protein
MKFGIRNTDFIEAAMQKGLNPFGNDVGVEDLASVFTLSIVGVKNLADKTLHPFR